MKNYSLGLRNPLHLIWLPEFRVGKYLIRWQMGFLKSWCEFVVSFWFEILRKKTESIQTIPFCIGLGNHSNKWNLYFHSNKVRLENGKSIVEDYGYPMSFEFSG